MIKSLLSARSDKVKLDSTTQLGVCACKCMLWLNEPTKEISFLCIFPYNAITWPCPCPRPCPLSVSESRTMQWMLSLKHTYTHTHSTHNAIENKKSIWEIIFACSRCFIAFSSRIHFEINCSGIDKIQCTVYVHTALVDWRAHTNTHSDVCTCTIA